MGSVASIFRLNPGSTSKLTSVNDGNVPASPSPQIVPNIALQSATVSSARNRKGSSAGIMIQVSPADKALEDKSGFGYYYLENRGSGKTQKGPVNIRRLMKLKDEGTITRSTLIWHKSFGTEWKPLADLASLWKDGLNAATPIIDTPQETLGACDDSKGPETINFTHDICEQVFIETG